MNAIANIAGRPRFFAGLRRLPLLLGLLPWAGEPSVAAPFSPAEVPAASATASAAMDLDHPVEREVLVPDGFLAWRTHQELYVKYFAGPLKPIKLKVGAGRSITTTANTYVYPVGEKRPEKPPTGGDLLGYPAAGGGRRYEPGFDSGLEPGKPCVVEMEVFIIEIHESYGEGDKSVPGGGKDKVIWKKRFRQVLKEKARLPEKIRLEMMGPQNDSTRGLPGLPPQK